MRKLLHVSAALVVVLMALGLTPAAIAKGKTGTATFTLDKSEGGLCVIDCGGGTEAQLTAQKNALAGDTEDCCKACLVACRVSACEAWGSDGTYVSCVSQR